MDILLLLIGIPLIVTGLIRQLTYKMKTYTYMMIAGYTLCLFGLFWQQFALFTLVIGFSAFVGGLVMMIRNRKNRGFMRKAAYVMTAGFILFVVGLNLLQESSATNAETATVTRVVDGDTIEVNVDGKTEDVRLLLVDTPETTQPEQPYGQEASQYAKEQLAGKQVRLEYDGPRRDNYDRLLAYIWVDGRMFNQMLLEEGLARLAYVYDPPYDHFEAHEAAEQRAANANKGIWSIDGYVTDQGFREDVVEDAS